jgi:hypothetical protein
MLQQEQNMMNQQNMQAKQQQALANAQNYRALSPDAQSQVGGDLTPLSFAQMVSTMAGTPGDAYGALHSLFNQNSIGTTPGLDVSMNYLLNGNGTPTQITSGMGV